MTQIDPIQAQVAAARRTQILDAATKVFAEKGFHSATIKDVAKTAGIADGTIYNYFENKTALLLGILDRINESAQREAHFQEGAEMDIREWTRAYIRHRFSLFGPEVLQVFRAIVPEILVNKELQDSYYGRIIEPTFEMAIAYLRKRQAAGEVNGMDPALAMRLIAGTVFGVVVLRLMGDTQLGARWEELPDLITDILLNGLLPEGTHE